MKLATIIALLLPVIVSAAPAAASPEPGAEPGRAVQIETPPGFPRHEGVRIRIGADAPVSAAAVAEAAAGGPFVLLGTVAYVHLQTDEVVTIPGVRIRLESYCGGWSEARVLAETYAAENGEFRIEYDGDYCATMKLTIYAENAAVTAVHNYDPWFWCSDGFRVEEGGTYDLGVIVPYDETSGNFAKFVADIYRARKLVWYLTTGETGPLEPPVTVRLCLIWGVDGGGEILLAPETAVWNDGRIAEFYANLWLSRHFDDWLGWDDFSTGWYADDPVAAYWHGIALWMADFITHRYTRYFTYSAYRPYDFETPQATGSGDYADPERTPGFFAAVLRDIQDAAQDIHTEYGSGYADDLILGHDALIEAIELSDARDPLGFLQFLGWFHSEIGRNLWTTAMNSGYQMDDEPPGVITNVTSSHVVGVPSADATIQLDWTAAADAYAGIGGYSVVAAIRTVKPDTIRNVFPVTQWVSAPLDPGNWYVMIRAVDRAGNWADDYATLGPYTIADAGTSDLRWFARTGWYCPVVPRPTADASSVSAPMPTLLPTTGKTYLSACGTNAGGATDVSFGVQLLVDGDPRGNPYGAGPVGAMQDYWILNRSTFIGGGRHVVGAVHDATGVVAEASERNNDWAWQWVWEPRTLEPDTTLHHAAPPDPEGGWEQLPASAMPSSNCDGYRANSGGEWRAVFVRPDAVQDDFSLGMCLPSSDPFSGFSVFEAHSNRGVGRLNGIVLNGTAWGSQVRDFAVTNHGRIDGTEGYELSVVRSQDFAFGDTVTVVRAAGEPFLFYRVPIAEDDLGWVTVIADVQPATQRVHWFWFDRGFVAGELDDSVYRTNSRTTGRATWTFEVAQPGEYALVVLTDPIDGTAPDTLNVAVVRGLPDFEPFKPLTGWPSALVPRPDATGTADLVALPDTLTGNAEATWFNFAFRNANFTDWNWDGVNAMLANLIVDGTRNLGGMGSTVVDGWTTVKHNLATPRTVAGGRHTVSLVLDLLGRIPEMSETNNAYAVQYCWSPLELAYGSPVTRPAPPDPYGGFLDLPADSTRWFNCDGLRLPVAPGRFGAVAVLPGAGGDVDIRLHAPLRGVRDGFTTSLAASHADTGQLDYVLVDFTSADVHPYDVGLVNFGGDGDCLVEATASAPVVGGSGPFGPFALPAGRLLDLHEMYLEPGYLEIGLENVSGAVDWGIGLHAAGMPFQSRQTTVDSVTAFAAGPGADETLQVQVPAAGWYAVAVWKAGSADRDLAGEYRLVLRTVVSDAPGTETPGAGAVGLVGVHPNPFNPRTTLDLVMPAPGRAELAVFDTRGRRVRLLWNGDLPAGRRAFVWDGRDDGGRVVAAGAYLARLRRDGGAPEVRKLTLVK